MPTCFESASTAPPVTRSRIVSLCLDANDPQRMALFWAEALGWNIGVSEGETALIPTDDTGFVILFEPTSQLKIAQNNTHLDLTTSIDDQRRRNP